ncbi:MAG: recombinase family protein [Blastocatellia bacterium]|nr:recombinase family protein [Blastocatellia bacterium]
MSKSRQVPLRVGVAAMRLGLHTMTLRRWVYQQKIQFLKVGRENRIPSGEITRLMEERHDAQIALYARVSTHDRKADLQRQIEALQAWAKKNRPGKPFIVLSEVGKPLDFDRKKLRKLFYRLGERKITEVVVLNRQVITEHQEAPVVEAIIHLFEHHIESCGAFLEILAEPDR